MARWGSADVQASQKERRKDADKRRSESKVINVVTRYNVVVREKKNCPHFTNTVLLFVDLLGNMVGRQNARKGARRLFTVLQNKRLNQDLVYTLLDEFIFALFPELNGINLDKKL